LTFSLSLLGLPVLKTFWVHSALDPHPSQTLMSGIDIPKPSIESSLYRAFDFSMDYMRHVTFRVALPHRLISDAERLALAGCLVVRELKPVKGVLFEGWISGVTEVCACFFPAGRLQVITGF
jgi:hypothetical protein